MVPESCSISQCSRWNLSSYPSTSWHSRLSYSVTQIIFTLMFRIDCNGVYYCLKFGLGVPGRCDSSGDLDDIRLTL